MNWTMVAGFSISFVSVFLKGLQQQNITGGHYKLAFGVSYLMATVDVAAFSLVVHSGWIMAIPYGTGGALGIVTSMYLHRRYIRRKESQNVDSVKGRE